jgi:uncharacterized protein
MKNRLAIGSLILLSASVAHSASFDCAKASTFVEKAICSGNPPIFSSGQK